MRCVCGAVRYGMARLPAPRSGRRHRGRRAPRLGAGRAQIRAAASLGPGGAALPPPRRAGGCRHLLPAARAPRPRGAGQPPRSLPAPPLPLAEPRGPSRPLSGSATCGPSSPRAQPSSYSRPRGLRVPEQSAWIWARPPVVTADKRTHTLPGRARPAAGDNLAAAAWSRLKKAQSCTRRNDAGLRAHGAVCAIRSH